MRSTTSSGSLAALLKIISSLLLVHLLAACTSAYPFRPSDIAAPPTLHRIEAPVVTRSLRKRDVNGDVPGVDEVLEQVQAWGVVGNMPSVFYTEFPMDLSEARGWASCYFPGESAPPTKDTYKFAVWHRLVDKTWMGSTSLAIQAKRPEDVSVEDNAFYSDLFLKHLAQAFAEASSGDVYLAVADDVTTDDRAWDDNKAWGGWEWPALTRNSNVQQIFRVDPNTGNEPRLMWTAADGPQCNDPKGIREATRQVPRS